MKSGHPGSDTGRGKSVFSLRHRLLRAAFGLSWALLAAWTPAPFNRWRCLILRAFGAKVAPGARVYGAARIWYPPNLILEPFSVVGPRATLYCMGRMRIGAHAIVSQGAHLCGGTHDIRDPAFPLITREIDIGPRAWICADAFVGPGVRVGEGAVLAARAAAFADLPDWTVWRGNPAAFLKDRPRLPRPDRA